MIALNARYKSSFIFSLKSVTNDLICENARSAIASEAGKLIIACAIVSVFIGFDQIQKIISPIIEKIARDSCSNAEKSIRYGDSILHDGSWSNKRNVPHILFCVKLI